MVTPLAVRAIAAAIGVLLIGTAARSIVGTVIVPRPVASWLTRWVDKLVSFGYSFAAKLIKDNKRRDRLMAGQAAVILLMQLVAWLAIFFVGFSLLLWPFVTDITVAFTTAGPAMFEIGSERVAGAAQRTILDIASLTGIVTVTLQIAYLPTLYSAFNRRETEVALLNARAGVPSWGPELLARTHYALGSGMSTIDTLPDLYAEWERWAADVAESHTTYLPLVRFRSPKPLSSWVTALLSVLDSAALYLALSPKRAPVVAARLCLRSGFICFGDVARAMDLKVPEDPDPAAGISITYEQFLDAVARMEKVDFPIDRKPEDAWPDFVGWRVNYEQAAFAVAYALDVVPALWSGPRPHPRPEIAPIRPPEGRPPK
jgi:type IV secretory pathway TrbD component